MTNIKRIIRQSEVAVGCFVGAVGYMMCHRSHFCRCGHLAHGKYKELIPWVVDGLWIAAVLVAGVVGLRGGFLGARITGIPCLMLALSSVILLPLSVMQYMNEMVVAGPLFVVGSYHILAITLFSVRSLNRKSSTHDSSKALPEDKKLPNKSVK